MARLQHLERLALGRSPFQAADATAERRADEKETEEGEQQSRSNDDQQYDSSGRPVNPATEERNQAMRNAQNAVLSLIGVVENKDARSREIEAAARQIHHFKAALLEAEQDRGEDFDLLTPLLHAMLTWWPETLIFRVQAGMFASSMAFTSIIRNDVNIAQPGGLRGLLGMLLNGLPVWVLFYILRTLLAAGIGEGIGQLQEMLNKRLSRKRLKQVNSLIKLSCEIIPVAIDAVFLPLQYLAFSQSLGLASAWPPLANWRLLLPWNMSPVHSIIWTPTFGTSALASRVTSPAALMLLKNFFERDQGDGLPIAHQFTSFEYPGINAPTETIERLRDKLHDDPFGRLLYECYRVRARVMKWFGWNLEYMNEHPDHETKYQNNHIFPPPPLPVEVIEHGGPRDNSPAYTSRFRSTSLAHQPGQYLSDRIDEFFARLLMLPLDSLVVRAITQSYFLSGYPLTRQAVEAAPHVYLPFGGGPLCAFRHFGLGGTAWREVGSYANKLSLSLALASASEVGVFFIVHGLCRWQGVSRFGWGDAARNRLRQIRSIEQGSIDDDSGQEEATGDLAAL